jgi:hypothetical protein
MRPTYIPVGRSPLRPGLAHAPLRRALPAGPGPQRPVPTTWLLFWGAVALLDIELALAYLLHFVAGVLD